MTHTGEETILGPVQLFYFLFLLSGNGILGTVDRVLEQDHSAGQCRNHDKGHQ